jgi:hypothetical protein
MKQTFFFEYFPLFLDQWIKDISAPILILHAEDDTVRWSVYLHVS